MLPPPVRVTRVQDDTRKGGDGRGPLFDSVCRPSTGSTLTLRRTEWTSSFSRRRAKALWWINGTSTPPPPAPNLGFFELLWLIWVFHILYWRLLISFNDTPHPTPAQWPSRRSRPTCYRAMWPSCWWTRCCSHASSAPRPWSTAASCRLASRASAAGRSTRATSSCSAALTAPPAASSTTTRRTPTVSQPPRLTARVRVTHSGAFLRNRSNSSYGIYDIAVR